MDVYISKYESKYAKSKYVICMMMYVCVWVCVCKYISMFAADSPLRYPV